MSEVWGFVVSWYFKLYQNIMLFSLAVLILSLGNYTMTISEINRQLQDGLSVSQLENVPSNYTVTEVTTDDTMIKYNIQTNIAQYIFDDIDINKTISIRKNN